MSGQEFLPVALKIRFELLKFSTGAVVGRRRITTQGVHAVQLQVPCVTVTVPVLLPAPPISSVPAPPLFSVPPPVMPPDRFRLLAVLMLTAPLSVTVPADVWLLVVAFQVVLVSVTAPVPNGEV